MTKSKVEAFAELHRPGNPLILFNIWDAGSAVAVAGAGAKAIATGSWGVAAAHGHKDGEKFPIELALANAARIVAVTELPVTLDLEAGYGSDPAGVGVSAHRAQSTGVVGINLEDKDPATRQLFETAEAAERIAAAAASGLFVNARADLFILTPAAEHDQSVANAVLERAKAYADAGARGLFVPYLTQEALIAEICERSPLPVNILIHPDGPAHTRLAELGVARISHGHGPWAAAMDWLAAEARHVLTQSR
jgi:2-methylisocitrate lyase-like PEP mutase family enzyme